MKPSSQTNWPDIRKILRDERVLAVLSQIFVFSLVALGFFWLYTNMSTSLQKLGIPLSLRFLSSTASFDIGERLIEYTRQDTFLRAFYVGVLNTLLVSALGIIFSTIFGIMIGVATLSTNWLVNKISLAFVELMRNIPLLVLLVFWYFGVFITLPPVRESIPIGPTLLSNRGFSIPWGIPGETFGSYRLILLGGLVIAVVTAYILRQRGKKTGRMPLVTLWAFVTFGGVAILGWLVFSTPPLTLDFPQIPDRGFNIIGGKNLTPEFMALLSGLVLYTAAFVGEVVRAGIQSVSKGQGEAARALGLTQFQTLRLVIFPQALRVIIPPLTSQYLNLTKNSSLAVAIGYPDIVHVYGTIINTSGRAVEMTAIMMATYLLFSLVTSLFMNWYNQKTKLVER